MREPTLSERLAAYVTSLDFADIPSEAIEHLKKTMTHDLVLGIISRTTEEATLALRFINSDVGVAGRCTVIGEGAVAAALDAAFVNAVMIRTSRQQTTMLPAGINGGSMLIPVALALAEQHKRSGRDVIAALVAGFDVCGALDRAAPEKRTIRTSSHVYGGFGAAAVAAKLMKLDAAQTATALAYAGDMALMIMAGFGDHQYGLAARNGITAAYLGQAGAPAPRDAFEGDPGFYNAQLAGPPDSFEPALAGLGVTYDVMQSKFKHFPGAAGVGPCATMLAAMVKQRKLRAEDVTSVHVHRRPETNDALKHAKGPFKDLTEALSSVPLALGAILLDGEIRRGRQENYNEPALLKAAQLVEIFPLEVGPELLQRVEVRTYDGAQYTAEGGLELLTIPDPEGVARWHCEDESKARAVKQAVERLDALQSVDELTAVLACKA